MKLFTSVLTAALALVLLPGAAPAGASETVRRTYGTDRIGTAVAASQEHRDAAGEALLATAGDYPDALAAGVLAGRLDAPLLLTHSHQLPEEVADELARLGVHRVWLLGGTAAISVHVETELLKRGHAVERLAGTTRYGTASALAQQAGPSPSGEVIVALGAHNDHDRAWADAVASGALAGTPTHVPTLLTRHDAVPGETLEALDELGATKVLLLGGTAAISTEVQERLEDGGYAVERIAGSSRYETSVAVATMAAERSNGTGSVVFASGGDFPDALSAGALSTSLGGPLVLVPPTRLSDSVDEFVRSHRERWDRGVLVGGPSSASDWVARELAAALDNEPRPQPVQVQQEPEERVVGAFEGKASWYGGSFHGRTTACGEVFDRNGLTAAHRTLPCGTRVRVTNTANGAQVIVRITDRGPYSHGRVIDVSERAAHDLGFVSQGTAWVRGEILE